MQNLKRTGSLVNGKWYEAGDMVAVFNPATNACIAEVANADISLATLAVEKAHLAFSSWSTLSSHHRSSIMLKWHQLILDNLDELAEILTIEQGKPLKEAKSEIAYSASFVQWFAEEAKRVYGDVIPSALEGQNIVVTKQGVGVVGAITPWNFPSAMIMRKASAALAAGCTFVVKPDIQTPLSALALADLALQAGIPNGVFNVLVSSDAEGVGRVLTEHPKVAKFTFTGSTRVGKILMKQCASTVKRMSMELGGNAPFIVFDDADIEQAVAGAIASKYRNAGQTCICSNRFFIHERIVDQFTKEFVKQVSVLKVGNGLESETDIGPLINKAAVTKVETLLEKSLELGAHILSGGRRHPMGENFFTPTVVGGVTNDMALSTEEIFGPISPIISFRDEDEVINMANNTDAGLAAYFYSENIKRVWRVASALSYGMIGINESAISNAHSPFGGIKQSGFGREGSKYGLDDYLEIKYLCMGS